MTTATADPQTDKASKPAKGKGKGKKAENTNEGNGNTNAEQPTKPKLSEADLIAFAKRHDPAEVQAFLAEQQRYEMGLTMFGKILSGCIEFGMIEAEDKDKINSIRIDSDGNIRLSKKRPRRTIEPSADEDDTDEDEDEEDADYAQTLVNALIAYRDEEDVTQGYIAKKLKPRGRATGKQPSQATVSNWLNGKSLPNKRYHKRIERLVKDYLTDEE